MEKKYGNIDPSEALAAVNRFFDQSDNAEVVALAGKFSPQLDFDVASDLRLSHHASEASWRLMTSTDLSSLKEASRFALDFCGRLDQAAAFIAGNLSEGMESPSIGVQVKRMLVSQTAGLEPLLKSLVVSSVYKEVRGVLQSLTASREPANPQSLEKARQFLASVSLALDEAIL